MQADIAKGTFEGCHIPLLDGFRGMAILLVISMHYTGFAAGWIGVDLFFVLSGFLISLKLVQSMGRKRYVLNFYWRRILRICPLYFATLMVVFVLFPLWMPSLLTPSYIKLIHVQNWYWSFTQNFYNAFHGWPDNISIVHFWSLATEMQFYLCWPFVILFFYKKPSTMAVFLCILVVVAVLFRAWADHYMTFIPLYRYVLLPSRIDAFAIGCLLFLLVHHFPAQTVQWIGWLALAGVILNVLLYVCFYSTVYYATFTSRVGYTLFDITWAALMGYGLLFAGKRNIISKLFTNRFMTATGTWSYAMYVFHLPLWTFINRFIVNRYGENYKQNLWGQAGLPLMTLAMVYGLAILSYYCFEKYMFRLKKVV